MEAPDFWDNAEVSQMKMKQLKSLKDDIETYHNLETQMEDMETMIEMGYEENDPEIVPEIQEMLDEFQASFDSIRVKTLLSGEYDGENAIIKLNAGAGGTEACDWCGMLYRMYSRWAEKKGFALEVLDYLDGDEAGVKSVTFQVNGENAYGYLKSEKGVHRLVRISLFNAAGKRQTSFVSCEVDIYGTLSEFIGQVVSDDIVTLLDINNSVPKDMYKESIEGKFDYTLQDTFMGFHCGNTASSKLAFCEMKYQMIMARSLPIEVTNGTLEGDIKPGDITFYRLQSTADNKLRAYIAHGEVLPVATRSFGAIGVFAIPEMGRFYRHVLIEGGFPHHGAVAFGHHGKALFEVFKYIGVPVEEIGYNQPAGVRYPTENPWK